LDSLQEYQSLMDMEDEDQKRFLAASVIRHKPIRNNSQQSWLF
jgi:hypothetical protein